MKKHLINILCGLALLTACNSGSEIPTLTPEEQIIQETMGDFDGTVDMTSFVNDVQQSLWTVDRLDVSYSNGEFVSNALFDGGSVINRMMLFPDGTGRIFYHPDDPRYEPFYEEIEWSVSESLPNTIELYNPRIELEAPTANYDQHAARTTLELLSYRKGLFVMKGMQPFAYWGGRTSDGIYYDYCLISGKLVTDRKTIDTYLGYAAYDPDVE